MAFFHTNIGIEFQKQMADWFAEYPEVHHEWINADLIIYHPTDKTKKICFTSDSQSVTLIFQDFRKKFRKRLFQDIATQVLKIRGYWINNVFDKMDLEIRKPKLSGREVAVLHSNAKYGQVLTTKMNVFTGWGEVYKVFSNADDAKSYCNSLNNDEIETTIYDSDYNILEQKID